MIKNQIKRKCPVRDGWNSIIFVIFLQTGAALSPDLKTRGGIKNYYIYTDCTWSLRLVTKKNNFMTIVQLSIVLYFCDNWQE